MQAMLITTELPEWLSIEQMQPNDSCVYTHSKEKKEKSYHLNWPKEKTVIQCTIKKLLNSNKHGSVSRNDH